jgi:hypothetical protein
MTQKSEQKTVAKRRATNQHTTSRRSESTRDALKGEIVKGDRNSRFQLRGDDSQKLVLADDLYNNYIYAEPIKKTVAAVNDELQRLRQLVEKWKHEHRGIIDVRATGTPNTVLASSSGKLRLQFFVVPQKNQRDSLEEKLVLLDESVLNDPSFQIVRLDSILQ